MLADSSFSDIPIFQGTERLERIKQGGSYFKRKNPQKSLEFLQLGLESARELRHDSFELILLVELAHIQIRLHRIDEALRTIEQSLALANTF